MDWLLVPFGYIIGCCPTAYVIGKWLTGKDIRQMGDGNMGARNAYFQLGHKAGIIIFFIDTAKGFLPVFIAQLFDASQTVVLTTGLAAVAGHNWPIFLRFGGGRGEATTIGVLFAVIPVPMLIITVPVFLTLLLKKNIILTSAVLFISLPLVCWWRGVSGLLITYSLAMACLVGITHFFRRHRVERNVGLGSA
jgi:glycerol-3-phosphate acyltransferase PlsY